MRLFVQALTILRIFLQRLSEEGRSWYWSAEFRRHGARVGYGLRVKRGASFSLAPGAEICLGNNVCIAEHARIQLGPGAKLRFGNEVFLGVNALVAVRSSLEVGDGTQIAHNATLIDHDHDLTALAGGDVSAAGPALPVRIGSHAWIAANAIVLKGVTVESHSVVAAGAIAARNVPSRSLAIGQAAENRPLSTN